MTEKRLTPKQIKFVAAYNGNGTEAAREAGYKGNVHVLSQVASENLTKPDILNAIRKRQEAELNELIATRQKRQVFWTSVMNDTAESMKNRLRASELLGKSEGDFTDKIEHSGKITLEDLVVGSNREESKK